MKSNEERMKKNKQSPPRIVTQKKTRLILWFKPLVVGIFLIVGIFVTGTSFFVFHGIQLMSQTPALEDSVVMDSGEGSIENNSSQIIDGSTLFPIGVNPGEKEIVESPELDTFVGTFNGNKTTN